jgi:alpha-L-fucosidase
LRSRPYPQWFQDAKLGIFIHWGLYSVPAYGGKESYGEWYLRGLQTGDSLRTNFMKKNYGEDFTYRDFAPLFKAELFDAAEWAELFKKAGAKYILLVSKHHDGYCLWPSAYSPGWNSVDVGPGRDIVRELKDAVEAEDIKFGLYYSLAEWNHPLHRWYTDPHDQIGPYVEKYMIPQFKELVSTYRPKVLFADGEWYNSAEQWHARELIAWYYNLVGEEAIVNNRWGGGSNIGFLTPEYSAGINITDRPWAECRGLGRSFGLNRNESLDAYMTPGELIHFFVKAVGNGGGITLNVGPKADGQIPLLQQERLVQLGHWLQVNGEAIYGSKTWSRQGEEQPVTVTRIDPEINFNWVRNTPVKPIKEDDFTVTWTGFIQPDQTDNYTFEAKADDGIRVWIDNELIINQWKKASGESESNAMGREAEQSVDGNIRLKAKKKYPIRIEYYEHRQNAMARLFWAGTGSEKSIVPQKNLFSEKTINTGDGLKGTYRSMEQIIAYTKNNGNVYAIALKWPEEQLRLNIDKPAENTRVQLVGLDRDLPWSYNAGSMSIDISGIKYNELPNHHAWTFRLTGLGK